MNRFAAAIALVLLVTAAAFAQAPALSPCQRSAAQLLQAEAQLDDLRRAMVSLQVTTESLRGPRDQAAREARWHALEQELGAGCTVDRDTLRVSGCAPLEGEGR